MDTQFINTPDGARLVVLQEADFRKLVEAAEDAEDIAAIERFRQRLAAGEEELVPVELLDRILAGENRIRVWREHRGLTAATLAERAGIAQPFLSQIETGKREGRVETLKAIANALSLTVDDLID